LKLWQDLILSSPKEGYNTFQNSVNMIAHIRELEIWGLLIFGMAYIHMLTTIFQIPKEKQKITFSA
jgi:hypothetical protein